MSFPLNRAKALFSYSNLGNSSTSGSASATMRGADGSNESASIVSLETRGSSGDSKAQTMVAAKKKRRMIIAVGLLGVVIVTIVAVSVRHKHVVEDNLQSFPDEYSSATKTIRNGKSVKDGDVEITLKSVLSGKYRGVDYFNGTWIGDDEFIFVHYQKGLHLVNVRNPEKNMQLMSASQINHLNAYKYQISADRKYLMLQIRPQILFRHSTISEYNIVSLENGHVSTKMVKLQPSDYTGEGPFGIRYAKFSPTGNSLVYVGHDLNIYYRRSVMSNDEKLTDTGRDSEFFNGVPDWVFEEEVLEDGKAVWWSPDGMKLVFAAFNDTGVEKIFLKDYGSWKRIDLYPLIEEIAYPKVGTLNPTVQLYVVNFENNEISQKEVAPPRSIKGEVHFSRVNFADSDTFAVQWMNRIQNRTVATLCNVNSIEDCQVIFEHEEDNGNINYQYELVFDPNWTRGRDNAKIPDFVTILSDPHQSEQYRQLLFVSASSNSRTYLTKEKADVAEVLKWSKDGYIYYMSRLLGQPRSRHLFKVPQPSNNNVESMAPVCITCNRSDMAELHRRPCNFFKVDMSEDGSNFAMTCKGPDIPYTCLHNTESDSLISVYDDNERLVNRLTGTSFPKVVYMEVPLHNSAQKAQVKMYLPPDFDSTLSYPTVVFVYGGPGNQLVTDQYDQSSFQTYLSGSKDFIYIIIDPMGSGGQGNRWRFATYLSFGQLETASTIEVTKYLQQNYDYIDAKRTALWGWSYGGFLTLSVLGSDKEKVFACGASVAPVMDWRLYDSYYTERYMGLPEDNFDGYNKSRVIWNLENFRHKPFYLLHGTQDDNVHYQQSMLLSAALESKDILFRQQSYPDQDHSITRYQTHLYHSLTDFFLNDCFKKREERK